MKRRILSCGVGVVLSSVAAAAHHSISAVYDSSKQTTVDGVVVQLHFVSPHPFVIIDVKDRDGNALQWRLEMDNRSELAAAGMTTSSLAPGDRVVVTGSLARTQVQSLYIRTLDRPADGFHYEQVGGKPRIRTRK